MVVDEKIEKKILEARRVISNPQTVGGKPVVEGTRVSVAQIGMNHAQFGWSPERIQEAYQLEMGAIFAALSYYYDNKEEMDALLEAELTDDEPVKGPLSDLLWEA